MKSIHTNQSDTVELDFQHEQTLMMSAPYAEQYVEQHEILEDGLTADMAKTLACARLEWLLQAARPQLGGIWTLEDFFHMVNCFRSGLFHPDMYRSLAWTIWDDPSAYSQEDESPQLKELVDSVLALNPLQKVALADTLEQLWHRGFRMHVPIAEFLETLGIELREEVAHA